MAKGFVRQREEKTTWELNLAPMLDMLVSLVTILLISFTTIRIGIIETSLPQPVAEALKKDREQKKREVVVTLDLGSKKDMTLKVQKKDGSVQKVRIPASESDFNYERLHREAITLKQTYPEVFRMEVSPSEALQYKDVIKAMDQVRRTTVKDPKVHIKDEKTGKPVETNLLFPDVIFANVVEG